MIHKVCFSIFLILTCLCTFLHSPHATAQGIEWIKIKDEISFPLRDDDNGLTFQYFTTSAGTTGAYLLADSSRFRLHSGRYEYRGVTSLEIGPRVVKKIFGESTKGRGALTITHLADLTKYYSERELLFSVSVRAPYGTSLLRDPPRPHYYPTNLTKPETNYLAVLGVLVGVALTATGIQKRLEEDSYSYDPIILLGIIIAGGSWQNLETRVPDGEQNALSEERNKQLRAQHRESLETTRSKNRLITNTYSVEVKAVYE